jgi:amidase
VSTFVLLLDDGPPDGLRVAVKDCIDVAGAPSTWGSPIVARGARPAERDAACLAGVRAAGARIVGKANLHELCFGATGVNPWFGTPRNPFGDDLAPGGSSSGSTVAVVEGSADVAFGTDTTGSVRTPAAWCGATSLRTTHGRVPLDGVSPLAPSLDTVGPIGRDVAAVAAGMALLEPGFAVAAVAADVPRVVGRVRGVDAAPDIDEAVDRALAAAEVEVVDLRLNGWDRAVVDGRTILVGEGWESLSHLYLAAPELVGDEVRERFEAGRRVTAADLARAWQGQVTWQEELRRVFERVEVLALPTHWSLPQAIEGRDTATNALAVPASLAGVPAVALPVRPVTGAIPASVQLVGPTGSDERLLALARVVEAAAGRTHG